MLWHCCSLLLMQVHPHGTIPALLLENGTVMLESAAICLYIAQEFSYKVNLLPDTEQLPAYYKWDDIDTVMFIIFRNACVMNGLVK